MSQLWKTRQEETRTAIDTNEDFYELFKQFDKQTIKLHALIKETFSQTKVELQEFKERRIKMS